MSKILVGTKIYDMVEKRYGYVTRLSNGGFSADFCLPQPDQASRISFALSEENIEFLVVHRQDIAPESEPPFIEEDYALLL